MFHGMTRNPLSCRDAVQYDNNLRPENERPDCGRAKTWLRMSGSHVPN